MGKARVTETGLSTPRAFFISTGNWIHSKIFLSLFSLFFFLFIFLKLRAKSFI